MNRYNPTEIEPKWQRIWQQNNNYAMDATRTDKPKFYGFAMLPYPSGTGLHTGHVRTYTLADVTVRAKRQQGFNAYNPIGWDAFGLPAENYAIKTGISPQETIAKATARFKDQLTKIGMSHDWSKEVNTSSPEYYKWTQWIFTKLFEHGLAYQKESMQWWCEADQTVLANEQVINGKCWRHDGPDDPLVTKKALKQWFFKITDYADELLESAEDLDWPDSIKTMQKNWIGRSVGAEIVFAVDGYTDALRVFTTRPDTLYGATFMVVAPEHDIVDKITTKSQQADVAEYVRQAKAKSDIERQDTNRKKTGVFTGAYAINPVNGSKLPIWVADYVLATYGTGAIMAVPAHDDRDSEFARTYDLPVVHVIEPQTGEPRQDAEFRRSIVAIVRNPRTNRFLTLNWGKKGGHLFVGGGIEESEDVQAAAKREIAEETGYKNVQYVASTGRMHAYYFAHSKNIPRKIEAKALLFDLIDDTKESQQLEDTEKDQFSIEWLSQTDLEQKVTDELHATAYKLLVKGQCYHGEGIMQNSAAYNGLPSAQAREQIVADLHKQGLASSKVQYKIHDWLISRQRYWGAPIPIVHCAEHGAVVVPQDQLPVVLPKVTDYKPSKGGKSPLVKVQEWVNTTCPTCGGPATRETDTMDGYACSSWYFLRYLDPHNSKQAWDPNITNQWMPIDFYNGADHAVSHLLYARFWMHFFYKLGLVADPEPVKRLVYNAYILATDGTKMSKSKGNVVDPLQIVESGYGADALRVYVMFVAPYDMEAPWSEQGVPGAYRFLRRIWDIAQEFTKADAKNKQPLKNPELVAQTHKTIKKVTKDIQSVKFNTAVAALMELVNYMYKAKATVLPSGPDWRFSLESLLQMLAPFAPHIAEELWQQLGHTDSIHIDHWPQWNDTLLSTDTQIVIVQVNGKMRAKLQLSAAATEEQVHQTALANEHVKQFVTGKPSKTVYIPGKVFNIVV